MARILSRSRRLFGSHACWCCVLAACALCADRAWAVNPRSDQHDGNWHSIPAALPSARLSFGAAYDGHRNRMLVFGGNPTFLNDVWALSLGSDPAWSPIATSGTPPSPRYGTSAIYDEVNDRLIVFGGYDGGL